MRVLISGASGLIGTELQKQLTDLGHTPVVLVRRPAKKDNEVQWDPSTLSLDPAVLENIDAIVNLAGATTGKLPWTREYKKELIASRLNSTVIELDPRLRAEEIVLTPAIPLMAFSSGSVICDSITSALAPV